ncbi:hypothetical protein VOLCADRAFT_80232 [Volvox carteri f. nagariensis]|uniref:Cytochrome c oxidase assembly protein n=1 Tax=Volvox carteri f. nagariensis TaxID=3068 RepID=D8TQ48_VOLCA|nr:uncharacterized protein VOLCADRAFT_80232 [Volvox carteri f. nagariensis]EFJ50342.1 hypothetical protein VOLCADRAFT_80232 [Volvox carteri f. nagariensis]|eukprot:XP_002948467.1 hypothetical protein VOLCADRAFT_80232 [Volvox carteri f. nagariensis]
MSFRRGAALLARGVSDILPSGLETCIVQRLCTGASTSGRPWATTAAGGFNFPFGVAGSVSGAIRGLTSQSNRRLKLTPTELGLYWGAAAVFMIGVSYASVPLYRLFCAATGYGGTVRAGQTVEEKLKRRMEAPDAKVEEAAAAREIRVWFNADVSEKMPWEFWPTQEYVRVRPGQSTLVFFTAHNKSDKPVTGYSLYNVTPDKAAFYFNKIQCFCFEEQRLRGGETIDMPVFFYIDPEFATDWNCRNINDITLSYMFHKVEDVDEDEEDNGQPTVVKLHSGPHPAAAAPAAAAKA